MPSETDDVLASVVSLWRRQVKVAADAKRNRFGRTAARCWDYLGADYGKLYPPGMIGGVEYPELQEPMYKIRRNLTFDFVATFLPFIFHRVPHRMVTPSRHEVPPELMGLPPGTPMPPMPGMIEDKQRAWLLQWWLNYTPSEYDYRGETRRSMMEALVKGRGLQWIEMVPGNTGLIPAAMYGSVDDLLIDPDAERINEAGWVARSRRDSVWRLAELYGIPRDELSARHRSHQAKAMEEEGDVPSTDVDTYGDIDGAKKKGDVVDSEVIWTRGLGLGQKLLGGDDTMRDLDKGIGRLSRIVEQLGNNCYLVVAPGVPYPLNLPPWVLETVTDAEIKARLEWPIPFYFERSNPWPFVKLDFYSDVDSVWAQSPLKAALPLQEFIDRTYSFMMNRVAATSKVGLVCDAALEKEFTDWITSGVDLQVIFTKGKSVEDLSKMFAQVEFQQLHQDLLRVVQMVELAFEKSTGMTAITQGVEGNKQIRSASEAKMRQGASMNRPEDLAECSENWLSQVARAEGFAARVLVPGRVVAPLFDEQPQQMLTGEMQYGPLTEAWHRLVNAPPDVAAQELSYTIESGSARKKNKQTQMANAEMLTQTLAPPLLQMAAMNPQPWNAFVRFLGDAFDVRLDDMMISAPPVQQPMGQQPPGQPPQGQAPPPQQPAQGPVA